MVEGARIRIRCLPSPSRRCRSYRHALSQMGDGTASTLFVRWEREPKPKRSIECVRWV